MGRSRMRMATRAGSPSIVKTRSMKCRYIGSDGSFVTGGGTSAEA